MENKIITVFAVLLFAVGVVCAFWGIWQVHPPSACIALGFGIMWYAVLLLRSKGG